MVDVVGLRKILEETESLILGGHSHLLVENGSKGSKRTRDVVAAEKVLSSAEDQLFGSSRTQACRGDEHDASLVVSFDVHVIVRDARLLRCQVAGSRLNFADIIAAADEAIDRIEIIRSMSRELNLKQSQDDDLEARALGYKGFALARLGRNREALPVLERSAALFQGSPRALRKTGRLAGAKSGATLGEKRRRRESAAVFEALKACYKVCGTTPPHPRLLKYPRTAHLFDAGGSSTTEDDVVLSMDDAMLRSLCDGGTRVVVEEKVDGANMGFSLCPMSGEILVQNRSHYISSGDHKQFSQVKPWVETHRSELVRILSGGGNSAMPSRSGLVLYGEWVVARHSIPYGRLPGNFVAFDLFDTEQQKFYSRRRFHRALVGSGIPVVPTIAQGRTFGPYSAHSRAKDSASRALAEVRKELLPLLETASLFRSDGGTVEGIVLRIDEIGEGDEAEANERCKSTNGPEDAHTTWLAHRCKIVRPDFVRGCADGHWLSRPVEKQRVDYDFAESYLSECYTFAAAPEETADAPHAVNGGEATEVSSSSGESGSIAATDDRSEDAANGAAKKASAANKRDIRRQKEREAQLSRARQRAPRCVILCGLPAAGKSTFSERLRAGFEPDESKGGSIGGYTVVNQDKMGRKECVAVAGRASRGRGRVVVDRCNPTASERKEWVGILHTPPRGEISLVHFATDEDTCVERARSRVGHETIPEGRGEGIVRGVAKSFEEPTEEERRNTFGSVYVVKRPEDADAVLHCWGVRRLDVPQTQ